MRHIHCLILISEILKQTKGENIKQGKNRDFFNQKHDLDRQLDLIHRREYEKKC